MNYQTIRAELLSRANPEKAAHLSRFFKTGEGEYGAGDRFLGVTVPVMRRLARMGAALALSDTRKLLRSRWHEERMLALCILTSQYKSACPECREKIFRLYLANMRHINSWDLVDVSAPHIVGAHLEEKPRAILDTLAKSPSLWERRIAIVSTFHFIRRNEFADTLRLAKILKGDREDLIHKAAGWMLREVGKRDKKALTVFLGKHSRTLPRTMLRYAIEKFPPAERLRYLNG